MVNTGIRIVVGVDYGTTYSGISYVASNETDPDKIEVINQWPGAPGVVAKVPTRIAYAVENPNLGTDKWGFAVSSGSISYTWTKLLLDGSANHAEYDDPALQDLFGQGMMQLPPHRTAKQLCADYLAGLYEYMVAILCKKFSKEVYEITPIDLWLTVPAIWSDAAKDSTRIAAVFAGFGSRSFDRIHIISEPEAAALMALKPHLSLDSLDPIDAGESILVCDCGGGTVDITTYRILSTQPTLSFEELDGCVGIGAKCGSTYIDRNFNSWMTRTFGKAFLSLSPKRRGPNSSFMRSFETAKRSFGSKLLGNNDQKWIEIDHINMDVQNSSNYDYDEATVRISWHEMKSFFDPVVHDIIDLVSTQVDSAAKAGHKINRIVLVGGFGDSDYLNERMSIWCSQLPGNVKLTCPPQCQAAVVRGAALRGLEGIRPVTRLARCHYGYSVNQEFRQGIDLESHSYFDRFDGAKMCRHRVDWRFAKARFNLSLVTVATFSLTTNVKKDEIPQCRMTLYSCSNDTPPEYKYCDAAREVGEIKVRFSSNDFEKAERRFNESTKEVIYRFHFTVKMHMNAEEGVLKFSTFAYGKPAGEATVNYREIEAGVPVRDS
ncbi:hsp70-like protein [Phyllosticta citribraziliensis]|uniref:Hsp70-like protein n=1 Tax=Phyllosticta citribraziliensis TaxID=989973 RepID=A0ABR1LXR4_9PEZI